jgi:hypothetical protein
MEIADEIQEPSDKELKRRTLVHLRHRIWEAEQPDYPDWYTPARTYRMLLAWYFCAPAWMSGVSTAHLALYPDFSVRWRWIEIGPE